MKLAILITVALLASCQASNIHRHRFNILNDISNQIDTEALSSSKRSRNFVTMTQRPLDIVYHKPGTPTEITCEGIGAPAPNIRWFRNNIPIYEHDQESNKISFSSPSSLARITSTLLITRTRDKDEFTCVLSAKAKTARATTIVHTEEDGSTDHPAYDKVLLREPHILTSYKIFIDIIGSKVVLPCKTRGFPRPQVTWRNDKGNIIKSNERVQVLRSGKLVFSSLHWSDMGEYTCEASNSFGNRNVTTFVYPAKAE